jgi:hypothetical protein
MDCLVRTHFVHICYLLRFRHVSITLRVFVGLVVYDINCFGRDDGFSLNLASGVHNGIYIKTLLFRIVVFWLITGVLVYEHQHFGGNLFPLAPPILL